MRSLKVINILCEGESEVAYISKLQNYLQDAGILNIRFVKRLIGSGDPTSVSRAIKLERTRQRNSTIYVLIDKDLYVRSANIRKPKAKNCVFLYNYLNFEDFLVLHFSKEVVLRWQNVCTENGHFERPLNANAHEKLLQQNIISDYQKGQFPKAIQLDSETFNRLFENQDDQEVRFKSDFASFLKENIFNK